MGLQETYFGEEGPRGADEGPHHRQQRLVQQEPYREEGLWGQGQHHEKMKTRGENAHEIPFRVEISKKREYSTEFIE